MRRIAAILLLAAAAGILMSFFFRCVVKGMAVDNFAAPTPGMMTPYSAIFVFSLGVLASNLLFNTLVMRYPFAGERVRYAEYFGGTAKTHGVGMLGGAIWCLGSLASYIASGPPERPSPTDWGRAPRWWQRSGASSSGANSGAARAV